METEGTQIHILGDVLVAVASLDLKVPIGQYASLRALKWPFFFTASKQNFEFLVF